MFLSLLVCIYCSASMQYCEKHYCIEINLNRVLYLFVTQRIVYSEETHVRVHLEIISYT